MAATEVAAEEIAASSDHFIDRQFTQDELPIATQPAPQAEAAEMATTLRLRAAVAHAPAPEPEPEAVEEEKHGRFAINSLITRMTGGHHKEERPAQRAQPTLQAAPTAPAPVEARPDPYQEEQERVDIPAFLRRQAN